MTLKSLTKLSGLMTILIIGTASPASAQDNPLLRQNTTTTESSFESQARAIDLAATKDSNDPICQNIRANYNQELNKIVEKSGSDGMSLSAINRQASNSRSTVGRLNRINRNITGNSSGALGKAANTLGRGTAVVNDVAAIGGLFGISGQKMSQKKAEKKAAKLDAQAMDAVKQMGCPMSTFS